MKPDNALPNVGCRACEIGDCPRHCAGCGWPVAHHPNSCSNSVYRMYRMCEAALEGRGPTISEVSGAVHPDNLPNLEGRG